MNTATMIILVIAIVALAGVFYLLFERRRMEKVRAKFGPEYERVVREGESPRHAVQALEEREKRVQKYHIRSLTPDESMRFASRWRNVQERFVDDPKASVWEADRLVNEALETKGYPTSDFEHQTEDISVYHPWVVEQFRVAHRIAAASQQGTCSTEDLRVAMQHYRNLFEDISDINVTREVHK
jgi:hypothetical protein